MTPESEATPRSEATQRDVEGFVDSCHAALAANRVRIEHLAHQTEIAANRQPPSAGWSAAQCLEHAILTIELYLPHMRTALDHAFAKQPKAYCPTGTLGRGTLVGRLLLRALDPDRKRALRLRAPKKFRPPEQAIAWQQLHERAATAHTELAAIATAGETIDLNRIRHRTPISTWLRVSLAQALHLQAVHVARHLNQAERALRDTAAPGA